MLEDCGDRSVDETTHCVQAWKQLSPMFKKKKKSQAWQLSCNLAPGVVETGRSLNFCLSLPIHHHCTKMYQCTTLAGFSQGPGDRTQVFTVVKQALYPLSSLPSPVSWFSCCIIAIEAMTIGKKWTGQHKRSLWCLCYFLWVLAYLWI